MMPSEKAIISRIKEAFAHKINNQTWQEHLNVIKQQKLKNYRLKELPGHSLVKGG